jgi:hypothetical protein
MAELCAELEACQAELQGSAAGTQVLTAAPTARRHRRRPSPWPVLAAVALLIAVGAVVAFVLLRDSGGSGKKTPPAGGGGPPHLSAVAADDRFGTGGEHDDAVHLATDGSGSTYWTTETYNSAPSLDKPGVGLVLDAGSPKALSSLTVQSTTPGFTAEILAGNTLGGSTMKIDSSQQSVSSSTTYTLRGAKARYYILWITGLGSNTSVRVNEISAKG